MPPTSDHHHIHVAARGGAAADRTANPWRLMLGNNALQATRNPACWGRQGEVSPVSMGKTGIFSRWEPQTRKRSLPAKLGNSANQNRLNPCKGKPFDLSNESELESQKEISVEI
jgi:hypothetical protein